MRPLLWPLIKEAHLANRTNLTECRFSRIWIVQSLNRSLGVGVYPLVREAILASVSLFPDLCILPNGNTETYFLKVFYSMHILRPKHALPSLKVIASKLELKLFNISAVWSKVLSSQQCTDGTKCYDQCMLDLCTLFTVNGSSGDTVLCGARVNGSKSITHQVEVQHEVIQTEKANLYTE